VTGLGHLPRSPGTGEGGDWWSRPMGVKEKGTPRVCHRECKKTPASLGYPLSVFKKNSTHKESYYWEKGNFFVETDHNQIRPSIQATVTEI